MTQREFELFLNVAAAICAVFSIFNLAMVKRRGTSSYLMSAAFIAMGATILVYGRQGASPLAITGGISVLLLLGVDFWLRAPNQQTRRRR